MVLCVDRRLGEVEELGRRGRCALVRRDRKRERGAMKRMHTHAVRASEESSGPTAATERDTRTGFDS